MRIFILGYMGAGKSTVGKRLARRLNMPFVDLDDAFEARYKYSIPRFFDHFGEKRFREFEQQCLKEVIEENPKAVISSGGGTACHLNNISLMQKAGITVYLKMHPASLVQRLKHARRLRPVIRDVRNDEMQDFIEKELAEREQYYRQAQITVKGEDLQLGKLEEQLNKLILQG